MNNKHIGSSFDDFLHEENIYEEVNKNAIKRVMSYLKTKILFLLQQRVS
jgi:hypothetical protein